MIFKTLGQLSEVGEAIGKISSLQDISEHYDDIAKATEGLSVKNTLLALSSKGLTKEQAKQVLLARKVSEEEIEQALATSTLSASQVGATGSTFSLSSAFKGLTANVKSTTASVWAFLTTNPVGWIVGAVSAVAALSIGIFAINKAIDEHREKLIETGETARDEISQIKNDLDSMESSVNDAGKTFVKLVDGIDTLNNTNVSLTDRW